ncbi:hypothetical protein E2320_001267 [Naja naja]|nr:hypothetical protein E2320_001267 [Naja naja]
MMIEEGNSDPYEDVGPADSQNFTGVSFCNVSSPFGAFAPLVFSHNSQQPGVHPQFNTRSDVQQLPSSRWQESFCNLSSIDVPKDHYLQRNHQVNQETASKRKGSKMNM